MYNKHILKGGEKMKKTAKSILLVMVMAVLLLALTGCGENKKLVATKDGEDNFFGKYKETIEITFKDKKADKIVFVVFSEMPKVENIFENESKILDSFKIEIITENRTTKPPIIIIVEIAL